MLIRIRWREVKKIPALSLNHQQWAVGVIGNAIAGRAQGALQSSRTGRRYA